MLGAMKRLPLNEAYLAGLSPHLWKISIISLRMDLISVRSMRRGGRYMSAIVRPIEQQELMKLLDLYKYLHQDDPDVSNDERLPDVWQEIYENPDLHYLVIEADGILVSSCALAIIKNLTRDLRPYGLIEHVVTHVDHRNQGLGTKVVKRAVEIAREKNCYKVMLLTSSKKEETLRFYEQAGFKRGIKTGFIINFQD
jgi:GNAT superfamily N-acetyltransferase